MRSPLIAGYITTGWLIPIRPAVPCEIDVNHTEVYPVASANGTGVYHVYPACPVKFRRTI